MHAMVDLTLSDRSEVSTTDHHLFWDATTRTFTDAIDLKVGDRVLSYNGGTLTIHAARVYDRTLTAFNMQIDGIHTYYVGATPVLVHNSCADEARGLWQVTREGTDRVTRSDRFGNFFRSKSGGTW